MTRTLRLALLTLGDPDTLTGGYLFHRRLAEMAPGHAARVDFVSIAERPFPLGVLDGPGALQRVARLGVDAMILDSIAAACIGPSLVARKPGFPLIGMLHQPPGGIDHGPWRTRIQASLDRLAYRGAARLLVASDALATHFRMEGVPVERLRVVPPGRDVAENVGPPPGDLRQGRRAAFLSVGNWVARKGILDLLEAFAALPQDAGTLHLAGSPDTDHAYGARVRARLTQLDLARRVVVHGPLPREAVAALYQAADVFVLPSFVEPYGTVYGEAMAFGLPVVGWQTGNLPYLATHEEEGLIVPPGDCQALTEALTRLAYDAPLRHRLGRAARQRAQARPTWADTATLFFGAVREVLDA